MCIPKHQRFSTAITSYYFMLSRPSGSQNESKQQQLIGNSEQYFYLSFSINYFQYSYFIYYLKESLQAGKSCKTRIFYLIQCTLVFPSKLRKSLENLPHKGTSLMKDNYFYRKSRLTEYSLHFKVSPLPEFLRLWL